MFLAVSCLTGSAALVAVEFGGRITASAMGFRTGARVTGYFTYESGLPPGLQTSSKFNFAFEVPETGFRFSRSSYSFYVYNNWGETFLRDGFALEFPFPQGYGAFTLFSSNTALFANNNLVPPTIPALEQFDANRVLIVTIDEVQPHRTTAVFIDRLFVVPQSGTGRPIIYGVQRTEAGLSFRFLTAPSTSYAVEVAPDLAGTNWQTLTNVGPTMEAIAIIDAESGLGQRFYRIRKNPN